MGRVVLASASYAARSLIASAQRCVNLYPEINPADAAAPTTFYGTPGRLLWSTVPGTGGMRGLFQATSGVLFAVRGTTLYRYIGPAWATVVALATGTGPVYAADNGISAVFTDGSMTAPTVNLTTLAAGVMAGDGWQGANFVEMLDSFFIFNKPDSQQFYTTGALDLTLDALDFASAESVPDKIVRIIRDHNELWIFGERSIEVFGNSPGTFPFERINGATQEMGCAAAHSVVKMDNSLIWLGSDERGDAMIWRAQGYQPGRISTHAIEEEMRKYTRIDDAIGYSYQQAGHSFYVLTFPSASKTWCYDAATQLWHERAYRDVSNNLNRVRDNCHVFYQRKHLVGDWENGNIYALDLDVFTDNGAVIPRIKSFQHMNAAGLRQFFDKLTLDIEAGVGNAADPDPQVTLRWSDDAGKTWSSTLTASIGSVGEYSAKAVFNRLGMGRNRVFEVSTTAAVRIALQGAFINTRVGTS